jgi:ABC-type antimicrobial peptide transport system permease subunit
VETTGTSVAAGEFSGIMALLLAAVASISLIVGGIGIMNILLTSVVERTHEIGIRRTVGATRKDVALQFLTESLLMTASGGATGIVIGILVSWGITAYAGWRTYISSFAVLLALTVSFAVGLGFGLYPAIRAARLDPVDAVRYE